MALKYELDSIEGLDEGVVSLYAKDEESGKYRLGVEGLPPVEDVSGLKSKVDELLAEKKSEAEKRKAAEEAARKAAEEAARKSGDTEALERSWQEKLAAREAELSSEIEQYKGTVTNLTSGQTATKMASELAATVNGVSMASHLESSIKTRLRTEYREGKPVTVVLDKDGKPSAMSVEDLKKEYIENPVFAPLIVGTHASGAGPHGEPRSGTNQHAEEAKNKGDLTGFLSAHLNKR